MSGLRTLLWTLGGIAAVVFAHLAMDVGTSGAPRTLRRNALVPTAEKSVDFQVVRAGEAGTRLQMRADGAWKIVAPYPADADRRLVLRLADALAFAPVSDEMTDAELLRIGRTRRDFGLDKPRIVVTVGGPGKAGVAVSFGSATPAGDGVYATVGDSDTVYVVSSNVYAAADLGAAGFRHRSVFAVVPEDVSSFDVKGGAGRFVRVVRDGETWRIVEPVEAVASSSRVHAFLAAAAALEARDFVWSAGVSNETAVASASLLAGYGLDPESSVSVTLKSPDGRDHAASFGRDAGKDLVYALVQGGGAIVTVPLSVKAEAVGGAFVDTRIFPLETTAVNALSIDDGTAAYLLSRGADGAWRLDSPVSAAADPDAVKALVGRMLALRSSDVVADGVRVSIGTNAAPVMVSRKAVFAATRPEDLRAREITSFDLKLVKRIVVTDGGKKPVAVLRDAETDAWVVESAEAAVAADRAAIGKICAALSSLKAVRIERLKVSTAELDSFGLGKPSRTIAIDQTAEDSVRRNILIGDVTDGGRYATLGASDAVFVISSDSAAVLLAPIAK